MIAINIVAYHTNTKFLRLLRRRLKKEGFEAKFALFTSDQQEARTSLKKLDTRSTIVFSLDGNGWYEEVCDTVPFLVLNKKEIVGDDLMKRFHMVLIDRLIWYRHLVKQRQNGDESLKAKCHIFLLSRIYWYRRLNVKRDSAL